MTYAENSAIVVEPVQYAAAATPSAPTPPTISVLQTNAVPALRNTVRKLEQLMYELSLAQAAGREFKRRESEPLAASQPPADDDSQLSQV